LILYVQSEAVQPNVVAERPCVVRHRLRCAACEGIRDVVADRQSCTRRRIFFVQLHQLVVAEIPVGDNSSQVEGTPPARTELDARFQIVGARHVGNDELLVGLAELLLTRTQARAVGVIARGIDDAARGVGIGR